MAQVSIVHPDRVHVGHENVVTFEQIVIDCLDSGSPDLVNCVCVVQQFSRICKFCDGSFVVRRIFNNFSVFCFEEVFRFRIQRHNSMFSVPKLFQLNIPDFCNFCVREIRKPEDDPRVWFVFEIWKFNAYFAILDVVSSKLKFRQLNPK